MKLERKASPRLACLSYPTRSQALIERTGRASFLIFFLATVLFGSGVLMAASGVPLILDTGFTGFRPLCGRAGAAARVD